MTEKDNAGSNWRSKQNWIKNVLFKSGTDLMEITTKSTASTVSNVKNGTKKLVKKSRTPTATSASAAVATSGSGTASTDRNEDIPHKMVYYQSTPLMIKTEQPTQGQLCSSLRSTSTPNRSTIAIPYVQEQQQHYHLQSEITPSYNASTNGSTLAQQKQQHLKQAIIASGAQISTLPSHRNVSEQPFLANIKTEPLPHSITIYATSKPASSSPSTSALTTSASNSADVNVNGSNGNTALAATVSSVGRKLATNKPQFKCEQCGMTFGSKSAHTSHTKSHVKSGELAGVSGVNIVPHTASTLGSRLADAAGSEGGAPIGIPKVPNISGEAGGDPYKCNVCQKTFAVPARLIRHYRTHTGERPFECEFCHKLFSVKENLQVHRRIHTKERPYKCDVCGRAFEHSGKLHRHMRIHTGERPHKCSVCEKTFIQSGQLVIHMRTHTGEKPYKCPVEGCGKGFTCSKQLKVHSRTHTGEKPYHCDICFRDFGYNHVLKLHRVQHYGSKCYKCTICDETFKSKKEMEAHIKGHANEMPDDDEEVAAQATDSGTLTNSVSSSSSGETTSGPASPQSPPSSAILTTKSRKTNNKRTRLPTVLTSPGPSKSTPSHASGSILSAGSPPLSTASPSISLALETDHHNSDTGVTSTSTSTSKIDSRQLSSVASSTNNGHQQSIYIIEELPTDLSKQQLKRKSTKYHQQSQQTEFRQQQQPKSPYSSYESHSQVPAELQHIQASPEPPTINPALLEAASIASSRVMDSLSEEEVKQAALQIMQLRRAQQQQPQLLHTHKLNPFQQPQLVPSTTEAAEGRCPSSSPSAAMTSSQHILLGNDLAQYDDTREANELIEHYRRGELGRHGLHKGYAPVPKFESSLLNNEIIVRQVEAAIAPLRSSTESPERSSSPESDSMLMMADRDVMTLPLRKRKLYMHEGSPPNESVSMNTVSHEVDKNGGLELSGSGNGASSSSVPTGNELGTKVLRMSSVIQFAKAS